MRHNQPLLSKILELWRNGAVTKKWTCRSRFQFDLPWREAFTGAYRTCCNTGSGSGERPFWHA